MFQGNGILNSPTNQELVSSKILDANLLQEQNLPLGQVIVLANNGRYIFNLVVRPQTNYKPFFNVLWGAFFRLRESMRILNNQSAKVSRVGNDFDQINWTSIEQIMAIRVFQRHTGEFVKTITGIALKEM